MIRLPISSLLQRRFLSVRRQFPATTQPDGRWVAVGLLVFATVWLSHLLQVSLVPPQDSIEQLTWVRSLQWGYYKHPPLPTWLAWLPVRLFGASAATIGGLGAACTMGALALQWRLLRRLRGTTFATVALLAVLCITYYNGRLNYYNHNVVLLVFATASAALCWQAFTTRQLRWWAALGLALGLGALAKFQIVVTVASVLAFAWHQRGWRDVAHRRGLALAALVAALVFAPHAVWLWTHDFPPIRYAMATSLGVHLGPGLRLASALHWVTDQVLNRALPAWLLLAAVLTLCLRPAVPADRASAAAPTTAPDASRALILAWGVLPLVFMLLVGGLAGAALQLHWGTAFLPFLVPAVMDTLPRQTWQRIAWGRVAAAFLVVQALLLAVSEFTSPRGPQALRSGHWCHFDAPALARLVAPAARAQLGGPVQLVVGPIGLAGALALQLPEHPLVLIDGRADRSPWVPPDLLGRCGALQIGPAADMADGALLGAAFPALAWRLLPRNPEAPPCGN